MKHKFSLMGRVAIALVLALSLSLVMAVPASANPGAAALTVTITQPTAGSVFAKGVIFTVKAEVENTGDVKATTVQATIAIAGDATATGPLTKPSTPIAELAVGGSAEVTWPVTCNAAGPVTITVTPKGKDFITGAAIPAGSLTSGTVIIQQVELVPKLTVDITSPERGGSVSVGEFDVTAIVINTGYAPTTGTGPTATITVAGATPATDVKDLGNLGIGKSEEVTWTLTCAAAGPVTIKVTPAGQYGTTETIPDTNLFSDSIALTAQLPAALDVTKIDAPSMVNVCEHFTVTATVKNTGGGATATDVEANVAVGTTTDVPGENIGTGNDVLTEFSDTLENFPVVKGSLVITPTPVTTVINWETGAITVTYTTAPATAVAIVADYTYFTSNGTAEVVSGSDNPVKLGTLAKDEVKLATFTLHCMHLGDAFIRVNLTGKDANTKTLILGVNLQPKSAIVIQKEAAVLKVEITAPGPEEEVAVCTEFNVTATVQNTGASTAKDVTLTLTIGANAALTIGQVNPKSIGYLAPGAAPIQVTWILHCTAAGKSKIIVSPSGKDVLTGTAIPAGGLIPGSVTVLQSITKTDPAITLQPGWNLISLPLIPTDPSIDEILAGVGGTDVTVNKVAGYSPFQDWKFYTPGFTSNLEQMNDGWGYWIDVSGTDLTFTAYGVDLALPGQVPPTYDVVVGWNLIGFTGIEINIDKYLGPAVFSNLEAMYGYKAATGYFIPDTLETGLGYWLSVNTAGKIYP